MKVRPRRARVLRRGWVRLRVTCPRGESMCRVDLRLRRRGMTLARSKFRVTGAKTRRVSLLLKPVARRRLATAGSLRVTAVAAARDDAGNRAVSRTPIRLLRPRR
jgi:hypothetical protein